MPLLSGLDGAGRPFALPGLRPRKVDMAQEIIVAIGLGEDQIAVRKPRREAEGQENA